MTIVVWALFLTALWIFLVSALRGCSSRHAEPTPSTDSLFGADLWLWDRDDGGAGLEARGRRPGSRRAHGRVASPAG